MLVGGKRHPPTSLLNLLYIIHDYRNEHTSSKTENKEQGA
jgi:hypothetical protein